MINYRLSPFTVVMRLFAKDWSNAARVKASRGHMCLIAGRRVGLSGCVRVMH